MKVGIAAAACVVAGVLFAVGYNAYSFAWVGEPGPTLLQDMPEAMDVSEQFIKGPKDGGGRYSDDNSPLPLPPSRGPQPKAVVAEPTHAFGSMMAGDEGQHEFVIENQGEYPLLLKKGKTSCKCTISDLLVTSLEPGKSTKITLGWKANTGRPGNFRQTARILTNDPKQRTLTLTVEGKVTVLLSSKPASYLTFGTLTPVESASREIRLFSHHLIIAQLEVISAKFTNPEIAKFFDITFEPLPKSELEEEATSGVLGKIELKSGADDVGPFPIGNLRQTLEIKTNIEEVAAKSFTIGGSIVPEIDVSAAGWDRNLRVLDMGVLDKSADTRREITLWVRGPEWETVEVEVEKVTPEWIKVVKKSSDKRPSLNLQKFALEITIDKEANTADLIGPEDDKLGHILLKTTHSKTKQFDIPVRVGPPAAPKSDGEPATDTKTKP